jgi:putative phosphoesterase
VISDVHGNATALAAVLNEAAGEDPDLVVFGGDLTWGPLPRETLDLVASVAHRSVFVRGNAERAILELAARAEASGSDGMAEREVWLLERHDASARRFLAGFVEQVVIEVEGLGSARFCHGSPRSDEELITPATPVMRMLALLQGIDERLLVTAHTHLQFDREIAGIRSINPGSVGMPYQGEPGAFWAVLGPDVELRRTLYDLGEAVARYRSSGDPLAEQMVEILRAPPTPAEVTAHAESLEFSG